MPVSNAYCRIVQETPQALDNAVQDCRPWNLGGNLAQVNRPEHPNATHEPGQVTYACFPLVRSQLPDPLEQIKIELVDRHRFTPDKGFPTIHFIGYAHVDQPFSQIVW